MSSLCQRRTIRWPLAEQAPVGGARRPSGAVEPRRADRIAFLDNVIRGGLRVTFAGARGKRCRSLIEHRADLGVVAARHLGVVLNQPRKYLGAHVVDDLAAHRDGGLGDRERRQFRDVAVTVDDRVDQL